MDNIKNASILIVDDNHELLTMLCSILKREGFSNVEQADCCRIARKIFYLKKPDLMILDINLPDGDGFSLFKELKMESDIPALFLSARDEDTDRLFGLGLGADDYITKPFLTEELILRIQIILKRAYKTYDIDKASDNKDDIVKIGDTEVNFSSGLIVKNNKSFSMTAKEMAVLKKLEANRGNIVTFDSLCEAVWNDGYYGYENALMVHIRHLREKIEENPSKPVYILTVRGIGYKLNK